MVSPGHQTAVRAALPVRVVVASFAAGVGSMLAAGLLSTVLLKGGLSLTEADASTAKAARPVIELDIKAVEAKLDDAERQMTASRTRTDGAMNRLERLSGG